MLNIFGMDMAKQELLEHISSMSQIAGTRQFEYKEGKACGVKAVDVRAGPLNYIVLLDRGMDIANVEYRGTPIAWLSKMGVHAPSFFENQSEQFLRTFGGGMLTTCGLSQVGAPCVENGDYLGLHGRISHTPVEKYAIDEYWDNDDYVLRTTGQAREAMLYAENMVLKREIVCTYGKPMLTINDIIENQGYQKSPFMIMYHINFCFPIVSEYSKVYTSASEVTAWVTRDQADGGDYRTMGKPNAAYTYECFEHKMPKSRNKVYAAIINEKINLGVYLSYSPEQLPCFNQWKMTGQQDYVVAFEPGNTLPVGRVEARKNGTLSMLEPHEKYSVQIEIGILDGTKAIGEFIAVHHLA
jgi:hypothetical protein